MTKLQLCSLLLASVSILGFAADPATTNKRALGAPEELTFKSSLDGTLQHYLQMHPQGVKKTHDILIAFHGHGSLRAQCATNWTEFNAARDFAAAHGMLYVAPDYRGNSWMGPAAEADMVQLIGVLRAQDKTQRIFLTGASMGGTSVLIFTALHPDLIAGVSSQNGMANMVEFGGFQDAITASYGGDKTTKAAEFKKRSPELVPRKFTMPVALAVGGKDTAVPPDSVRRLAEALKKQHAKVLFIDRPEVGHSTTYADTMECLEFMFKSAAAAKSGNAAKPENTGEEAEQ